MEHREGGISPTGQKALRIGKRVLGVVVVVIGVTFLAYLLSYLSPTDAATRYFTDHGMVPTPELLADKRHELGLDRPFL
ncbi:MAG: hypothetical protein J5804_03500, partial [Eggerthellaceae bacterium]|nr:hypothetical protein [Eggerthellaceae bacterium]